jgi:hypothetical protein
LTEGAGAQPGAVFVEKLVRIALMNSSHAE